MVTKEGKQCHELGRSQRDKWAELAELLELCERHDAWLIYPEGGAPSEQDDRVDR